MRGQQWSPDPKPLYRGADSLSKEDDTSAGSVEADPMQICESLICLREGGGIPLSFDRRPYLRALYLPWYKRMIITAGRQVEKSTTMSNQMFAPAVTLPGYRSLYVAPTRNHIQVFSRDRLEAVYRVSPELQQALLGMEVDNVLHKEYGNGSSVILRSAYLTADSARGIPADQLVIDEAQEMIPSHVPVLQETLSHSMQTEFGRRILLAGTGNIPESLLGEYWEDHSTQGEWMIKCACGHDNTLMLENIGKSGLICTGCAKDIDPLTGRWVHNYPSRKDVYIGFRIPQMINPVTIDHWEDLLLKLRTYPNSRLYNEVLGLPYNAGTKPIEKKHILGIESNNEMLTKKGLVMNSVMGIDWGYGDVAYTVVFVGGWDLNNKFRIVYGKRYALGDEVDPEYQIQDIIKIAQIFEVEIVGADWGAGWAQNARLESKLRKKYVPFYYSHSQKSKAKWDQRGKMFIVNRTSTMTDMFEAIKTKKLVTFRGFFEGFGSDFLNVMTTQDKLGKILYTHAPSRPDDAVHAANYCYMIGRMLRREFDMEKR